LYDEHETCWRLFDGTREVMLVTSHDQAVNWPDQPQGIATHESAPWPVFGWRDFILFGGQLVFRNAPGRPQHHPRCFTVAVEFGADAEALDPIVG
jgi:hypothetical protein